MADADSRGTSIDYVIQSRLKPFEGRYSAGGIPVLLDPRTAENFSLVLNELVTNAAKYGAFSSATGRAEVRWVLADVEKSTIKFSWKEQGGPSVVRPQRSSFGTTLITTALGRSRLEYQPDGLLYEVDIVAKDMELNPPLRAHADIGELEHAPST